MNEPNEQDEYCSVERMKSYVRASLQGMAEELARQLHERDDRIDVLYKRTQTQDQLMTRLHKVAGEQDAQARKLAALEVAHAGDHKTLVHAHALADSLARNAQMKRKPAPAWIAPSSEGRTIT